MQIDQLHRFLDQVSEARDWLRSLGFTDVERAHGNLVRIATAGVTLDLLSVICDQLAEHLPDTRISLTIARDGAFRALSGAPPTSAYIAAHAARRLDGPGGYAAERSWQSRWLVQRLGLRDDA